MVFTCLIFMAGPYDYTVNIPQPPAQNFLQSLLGIQQLKGLQQQGELAQQQAAIQQQNAQFAAQMQPLQLQAEQARIGQIGQATAASAEALRQGKITFEQTQQDRVRQMEQQAVGQARQQELFGKLNSLPANASMVDIVPIANQLALINPEVSKQIMDNFSALPEEYQKASKTALITATTQLEAGNIEGAKQTYSTFEQAIRNSGGNNPQLKAMADGIKAQGMILEANPNAGKLSALQMLGAVDTKALDSIVKLQEQEIESPLKAAQTELAKIDAQLKKLKLSGGLDSEETMKQENLMRENFSSQPLVRNFQTRSDNYNVIKNAENTPIGDRARIVGFIKLQDPTSVVSVTEAGQLTSTTPIASLQSLISKFNGEGILGTASRKQIDSQAASIFKSAESQYKTFKSNTERIAKSYGINPKNVVELFDAQQESAPATSQTRGSQLPISTGNLPVAPAGAAPAGGVFTIDGFEMKITPRGK
jgi:hypothetical protein